MFNRCLKWALVIKLNQISTVWPNCLHLADGTGLSQLQLNVSEVEQNVYSTPRLPLLHSLQFTFSLGGRWSFHWAGASRSTPGAPRLPRSSPAYSLGVPAQFYNPPQEKTQHDIFPRCSYSHASSTASIHEKLGKRKQTCGRHSNEQT